MVSRNFCRRTLAADEQVRREREDLRQAQLRDLGRIRRAIIIELEKLEPGAWFEFSWGLGPEGTQERRLYQVDALRGEFSIGFGHDGERMGWQWPRGGIPWRYKDNKPEHNDPANPDDVDRAYRLFQPERYLVALHFYSSLSQVTAAIVGFFGGFLILRLLGYITDWRELRRRLESTQSRWAFMESAAEEGERRYSDEAFYLQLRAEENRLWSELFRAKQEQGHVEMPVELGFAGVVLAALIGIGVIWPLFALAAPSNHLQSVFLLPWMILMVIFAALMYLKARQAYRELKAFQLWDRVEAQYEDQLLQAEAWEEHTHDKPT